jgi:hypothetical protein
MEQAPVQEMIPELIDNGDPENLENNIHVFSKKGEYYLVYVAEGNHKVTIDLPGDGTYSMDMIDTWNMEITPFEKAYSGKGDFELPDRPYMALRIVKQD